jgi:acyl-CoA thioester hydrolase
MSRHVYPCPLRWSDMDAYGHVNNVRFLTLLEEARVALFFTAAAEQGVTTLEGDVVVARHEIDYVAPLTFRPEPVPVQTWVERVGAASATIAYSVNDGDTVYARARTVVVAFDPAGGHTRRWTDVERGWLEGFYDEAAAVADGPVDGAPTGVIE